VIRESKEEIVNAYHRLAFSESIETELVLHLAIDILQMVSFPNLQK
jgi:hypothetical protein